MSPLLVIRIEMAGGVGSRLYFVAVVIVACFHQSPLHTSPICHLVCVEPGLTELQCDADMRADDHLSVTQVSAIVCC